MNLEAWGRILSESALEAWQIVAIGMRILAAQGRCALTWQAERVSSSLPGRKFQSHPTVPLGLLIGFRGIHRDILPAVDTEQEEDEGDPNPCPEDEDDFLRPDAEGMEEAISRFLDGMEGQEQNGFKHMHSFLAKLPMPVPTKCRALTHAVAIES